MDSFIFFVLHNLTGQNNFFDGLIIFISEIFANLVILGTFLFLIFHHNLKFKNSRLKDNLYKIKETFFSFVIGASAYISSVVLKGIFGKLRPFEQYQNVNNLFLETTPSFPSSHAAFYMALAFSVYFIHKKVGFILIVCALLIGTARVMAGVHYPVDILGGYVLGIIIAIFFNYLFKKE